MTMVIAHKTWSASVWGHTLSLSE